MSVRESDEKKGEGKGNSTAATRCLQADQYGRRGRRMILIVVALCKEEGAG